MEKFLKDLNTLRSELGILKNDNNPIPGIVLNRFMDLNTFLSTIEDFYLKESDGYILDFDKLKGSYFNFMPECVSGLLFLLHKAKVMSVGEYTHGYNLHIIQREIDSVIEFMFNSSKL